MHRPIRILALASFLALAGCAITPAQLHGNFPDVGTTEASTEKYTGVDVRWGGIVTGVRLTDAGECLEVAAYPLARYTPRPATAGSLGAIYRRPRFLACGAQISADEIHDTSGTVTVVGTIEPSKIFQVEPAYCAVTPTNRRAVYAGTIRASNDDACVILLPTVNIVAIHAWPALPSNTRPFNGH